MLHYWLPSKHFAASAKGSVIKAINCEQCGLRYFYQLTRSASGEASAFCYIGERAAAARAQRRADENLQKLLKTDCDLVPCPQCGHLQRDLISIRRAQKYQWLGRGAGFVAVLGLIAIGFLAWGEWYDNPRRFGEERIDFILAAAGVAGIGLLLNGLMHWLRSHEGWIKEDLRNAPPALLVSDDKT